MPDLTYPGSSRKLGGYLAPPVGAGPWPGVVVIHDAVGLSDDIREQADRLAAAGYLAFAPDLYSRARLRCVLAMLSAYRSGEGEAYDDIEAARRWLAERDDCTGRIGVIGFCVGGGFALMGAVRSDFDAAAVNYGEVPRDAARGWRRLPDRRQLRRPRPDPARPGRAPRARTQRTRDRPRRQEVLRRRPQLPQPHQRRTEAPHAALPHVDGGVRRMPARGPGRTVRWRVCM